MGVVTGSSALRLVVDGDIWRPTHNIGLVLGIVLDLSHMSSCGVMGIWTCEAIMGGAWSAIECVY